MNTEILSTLADLAHEIQNQKGKQRVVPGGSVTVEMFDLERRLRDLLLTADPEAIRRAVEVLEGRA